MKKLNQFITEKLKLNNKIQKYKYHPKTRDDLEELVDKLIEKRGLNANLNDIDTSEITDMSFLFYDSMFNGDISQWDVSNVENMAGMFENSEFDRDISEWNVSKVKDMQYIFKSCPLEKNPPAWYKK